MNTTSKILLVAFVIIIAGFGLYTTTLHKNTTDTITSGIMGKVMLGPTCPVMRIGDTQCADKPYATTIGVYATPQSTSAIVQTQSGQDGTFHINLVPGTYTLKRIAQNNSLLPRCAPVTVTVHPNTFATTTISCDTGIR